MGSRPGYKDIDEYIAAAAPQVRGILEEIRQIVKTEVPEARETISYQLPAFRQDRVFIYFAAFKKHIGIYPPARGDGNLEKALQPYRGERGNLKFPLDQPIPYDLIRSVVKVLAQAYARY